MDMNSTISFMTMQAEQEVALHKARHGWQAPMRDESPHGVNRISQTARRWFEYSALRWRRTRPARDLAPSQPW